LADKHVNVTNMYRVIKLHQIETTHSIRQSDAGESI